MKKRAGLLAVLLTMSFVLGACGSSSGTSSSSTSETAEEAEATEETETAGTDDTVYTMTLANHLSPESVQNIAFEEFIENVEEKSGGRIQINLSASGALGSQREIIEGVNLGTIEMGMGESGIYANYVPEFGVLALPFMYDSEEDFHAVLDGEVGELLAERLEEATNCKIISWMDGGVRDVYSAKPVETLADLEGLKIRTPESSVYIETFNAFGANPTPISANEMYSSIQSDVVSAMEGTGETAYTYKIYEVANYCLETGHIYTDISLVINTDIFESLPEDLQEVLLECGQELTQSERELWAEKSDQYKQLMIDEGSMQFFEVDKEEAKAAVSSVYDNYIDGDSAKQEIYDMITQ
ncbi:MAG: TRAP transporter substrate-binding protein [Lachnospiraceae bacterium]|nr:TRAP transporter substrate-binding protein [Lachnospiraceae bacterium]